MQWNKINKSLANKHLHTQTDTESETQRRKHIHKYKQNKCTFVVSEQNTQHEYNHWWLCNCNCHCNWNENHCLWLIALFQIFYCNKIYCVCVYQSTYTHIWTHDTCIYWYEQDLCSRASFHGKLVLRAYFQDIVSQDCLGETGEEIKFVNIYFSNVKNTYSRNSWSFLRKSSVSVCWQYGY